MIQLCKGANFKSCDELANIIECRTFLDDPNGYLREYFNNYPSPTTSIVSPAMIKSKGSALGHQRGVSDNNLEKKSTLRAINLILVYVGYFILAIVCILGILFILCILCPTLCILGAEFYHNIIDCHSTGTAQANNEVAASVPPAPPSTTQHPSGQPPDVVASHSHPNLQIASSLPMYEDVAPPQRRCVTPDPHMLSPTYEEADMMKLEGFGLRSTDGEIDSEPMAQFLSEDAPAQQNNVLTSHSHHNLQATSSLSRYEKVDAPLRHCVTPEPHMLLPTYEEAAAMASESNQRLCQTPTE